MAAFKLLTLLAFLGVAYSQNAAAPVLIWGNHHSIDKMTSNSGKISADNIEDLIKAPASEDDENTHVLIGILENLSLNDLFKKYGNENVFSSVKTMMDQSKYKNFLAQVNSVTKKNAATANASFPDVQNLVESDDPKQIRFIKITPKGEDVTETLKMADNIMYKACTEHASQYKSYICVMTGSSGREEEEHFRIARSLLQTQAPAAEEPDLSQDVYYLANFALVYTKPYPVFENNKTKASSNLTKTTAAPTPNGKTMFVRFQDKAAAGTLFRFGFIFENNNSSWSLTNISYGDDVKSSVILTPSIPITTSFGYSFHTPSKVVFKNDTEGIRLTFNSLQVEFSSKLSKMKFSMADDTVYFFTIPILSGLFVTSLLVTIVLLGLSMIFDIKTMDLFDDPKGKTVTINASD